MVDLDPRLAADSIAVGRFDLCLLRLMNDAHWPWFILVPDRPAIREIHELGEEDQQQLMRESSRLSRALARAFHPDKLNIAALGNIVPQLHVHHIVRHHGDPAWPAPVWGRLPAKPYAATERREIIATLTSALAGLGTVLPCSDS